MVLANKTHSVHSLDQMKVKTLDQSHCSWTLEPQIPLPPDHTKKADESTDIDEPPTVLPDITLSFRGMIILAHIEIPQNVHRSICCRL